VKNKCRLFFVIVLVIFPNLLIPQQLLQAESRAKAQPIPPRFFGMSTHWFQPWPMLQFSELRLWGTQTSWADLNPSDGVYDWTVLDEWIATAQQHGVDQFILTLAMTPPWASSNPTDSTCKFHPGQCDPPNDLNADGSGPDQHWKDYITAVATHTKGQIRFWEVWNEPVNYYYWNGTFAQMVRMAKDARDIILSIQPNALMLSPPNGASRPYGETWWKGYAALGGLNYADVIALHGGGPSECGTRPVASDIITTVANLRGIMAKYGAQDKSIWDDEFSWGTVSQNCFYDPDLQAAFLGQSYMLHKTVGIRRLFWFAYDDGADGKLWDRSSNKLTKGGVAFGQVYNWMLGTVMSENCSTTDNAVWSCGLSGPNGYVAEAIWDVKETCTKKKCQTINKAVDPTYTQYRTLDGQTIAIKDNHVPIGAKPILLENHDR
jgi:polysaccharide biosynthesis protein PslG